jgi:hypothetical protein
MPRSIRCGSIMSFSHTPSTAPAPSQPSRMWRQPALLALAAALLIVLAAFAPTVWRAFTQPPGGEAVDLHEAPWAADIAPDGALRVLSLRLPGSTLGDVQARWPDGFQLGLMAPLAGEGPLSLEAYAENARPGGIAGRVVLTARVSESQLHAWRTRAVKSEGISASTRRLTLSPDDAAQALASPISAVGFIPHAQLDANVLRHRFGEPQQIVGAGQPAEHWLYPARGLSVLLDSRGRELLQFVSPAEFDQRLRQPLLAASSAAAVAAPPSR